MKKLEYILVIVLVIILAFSNVFWIKKNNGQNKKMFEHRNSYRNIFSNINLNYIKNNYKIIRNKEVSDINNIAIRLSDIVTEPTLILEVSEFNCGSCVDSAIYILKKYVEVLNSKCVLLVEVHGERNRILFERVSNINLPIYYIEKKLNEDSHVDLGNKIAPFFYILDENLRVNYYFKPDKSCVDLTAIYIEEVIKKL